MIKKLSDLIVRKLVKGVCPDHGEFTAEEI